MRKTYKMTNFENWNRGRIDHDKYLRKMTIFNFIGILTPLSFSLLVFAGNHNGVNAFPYHRISENKTAVMYLWSWYVICDYVPFLQILVIFTTISDNIFTDDDGKSSEIITFTLTDSDFCS